MAVEKLSIRARLLVVVCVASTGLWLLARYLTPALPEHRSSTVERSRLLDDALARMRPEPVSWSRHIYFMLLKDDPGEAAEVSRLYRELSPHWRQEVITGEVADDLVDTLYGGIPEVMELWRTWPMRVLKADFLRYLLLFAEGGVYADVDTIPLRSLDAWLADSQWKQAHTVVGIEEDSPDRREENWKALGWSAFDRAYGLAQYVFAARAGSPVLRRTIVLIWERVQALRLEQGVDALADIRYGDRDVLMTTGPTTFTDAVLEVIAEETGLPVAWRASVTGIKEPTIRGGVAILPREGFNAGRDAVSEGQSFANVHHRFAGAWRLEGHPLVR